VVEVLRIVFQLLVQVAQEVEEQVVLIQFQDLMD
jgi:hypothetical protein